MQKPPCGGSKAEVNILKIYDFTSKGREFGRVVFALTLDRKRLKERVVIGKVDEVRRLLNNGDGEVYYDDVRPLGSLLLSFESDTNGAWNKRIQTLCESYKKFSPIKTARWDMVKPVQEFLTEKYNNGEPSAMFAAVRTWEDYINYFRKNHGADLLSDALFMLYKPFKVYGEYKPWRDEAATALSTALQNDESGVELWYPVAKRPFETVVTSTSFLPIIFYYTHKVNEWGYVFQQCKICDVYFLARSRHYELCSDECRKKKATTTKKEFDERTKGDMLEKCDSSAYYYWYHQWRKLKKGKHADPEKAAAFKVEFDAFRKEAVKRKTAVKSRKMSQADYSGWLVQQQELADSLMKN